MASAKINKITIAVNTLGAAEGLRPKALMLANPQAAMTSAGPKTQTAKIKIKDSSRGIKTSPSTIQ